jgi:hypothetical protein
MEECCLLISFSWLYYADILFTPRWRWHAQRWYHPQLSEHLPSIINQENTLHTRLKFNLFFPYFLLGIYFNYISNAIPKVTHTLLHPLPYPPTPTSWPWLSPVLRHIKFARPMGLSFHWWRLGNILIHMQLETRSPGGGGYWLVHIVVSPIGLQIPSAPWVLSLAPLLGALWPIQ